MALSRHPGSSSGLAPFHSGESETPTYLSLPVPNDGFTRRPSPRARPPFTRPCRPFRSAFAEPIRGQTPPNDFCNCVSFDVRATKPGLLILAGTVALTTFLFSTHHALSLRSGDARRAARRPLRRPRCWFFLLAQVCPAAMPSTALPLRGADAHGSNNRVKDASRGGGTISRASRPVPTLGERKPTAFPSLALFGHPRSSARSSAAEEPRRPMTSRPRPSFR